MPWYVCRVLAKPDSGEGERCGETGCVEDEELQASGDGGMLLVDLRRPTLEKRCVLSLEPRPWRELGRMWAAGELGELEQGDVL